MVIVIVRCFFCLSLKFIIRVELRNENNSFRFVFFFSFHLIVCFDYSANIQLISLEANISSIKVINKDILIAFYQRLSC